MDFSIKVENKGIIPVIKVYGEIDLHTAPVLDANLCRLIDAKENTLIVDLENCAFFDSEGIKVLIKNLKSLDKSGSIRVYGANSTITRIFQLMGLDTLFNIYSTG